ncbi:ATP-binding cassette domain-containing protein [Clostridium sp. B9]|uniref:ATP-binding cassette domain-containing protein n=1 Tax=Clostridium sp. B9 TaxID=3423224 RepID=UPI003D2F41A2
MEEYILQIQELNYNYSDGTHALKGINMNIKKGEITAILGGNGVGKSTLFQNLNGILKPSSGKILFEGKPIEYSRKSLMKLRENVGIVFQDPDNQLFSASVYQDVSFGAVNMKLPEDIVRKRVENALKRTGIESLKDKPTHCLSFGQKKRVAIAGVLVMEPKVLILDEPTAGLDPMGVSEIMKLLVEMQKELGITIIIATHDIDIVPLYCKNVYVMKEGKVILSGSPSKVFGQKETIRKVNLRLPRIGHLIEILSEKDDFALDKLSLTIGEARKSLNNWKDKVLMK